MHCFGTDVMQTFQEILHHSYFGPSTSRLCTNLYTLVWCIWCAVGIATLLTDSCDGIVERSKFPLTF